MITSDGVVNDEGKLVQYAFNADTEPVNVTETFKDSKRMQAVMEGTEIHRGNKTWSLVEFPQGKKEINVKSVYKVRLNPKGEVTRHNNTCSQMISLERRN